jgi:NitT/TauT family transport system substrate-binding protein
LLQRQSLANRSKVVSSAALTKWFNIKDATTQERMFHETGDIPAKPYPAVDGIKVTIQLYDSAEMRKFKPDDFYDASFIAELGQKRRHRPAVQVSTHDLA